jgi:hypothetical protein
LSEPSERSADVFSGRISIDGWPSKQAFENSMEVAREALQKSIARWTEKSDKRMTASRACLFIGGMKRILASIIWRESFYRLLVGDQGKRLRQMASIGSKSRQLSREIDWLKGNFTGRCASMTVH